MATSGSRVLVVAAHPDDEVLGCGGVMARHVAEGDEVQVLILAVGGAASRIPQDNAELRRKDAEAIRNAAREAAEVLGARPPRFLALPDNSLDSLPLIDVIRPVEAVIQEIAPDIVYTHHGGDLNVDHRAATDAVVTACRPLPGASVRAIYAFETLSSTEWGGPSWPAFVPSRHVDITGYLAAKKRAIECYASEMRPFPHARSMEAVEALARLRGAQVGVQAAEAFVVVREVV